MLRRLITLHRLNKRFKAEAQHKARLGQRWADARSPLVRDYYDKQIRMSADEELRLLAAMNRVKAGGRE